MSGQFRLTVVAQADFDGIGDYTFETWGEEQADKYLAQLDKTFVMLAQTPGIGKARNDLGANMKSCPCGSHIIFFRRDAHGDVEILRILHERMDFARHL